MNQAERDRLDALKRAKKKLITQRQAAEEIGVTERHRDSGANSCKRGVLARLPTLRTASPSLKA